MMILYQMNDLILFGGVWCFGISIMENGQLNSSWFDQDLAASSIPCSHQACGQIRIGWLEWWYWERFRRRARRARNWKQNKVWCLENCQDSYCNLNILFTIYQAWKQSVDSDTLRWLVHQQSSGLRFRFSVFLINSLLEPWIQNSIVDVQIH